jgi:hypothetical protein
MSNSAGHILKSHQVELEGQFHLNAAAVSRTSNPRAKQEPALTTPQVRILENNHEYAIIGIVCSCGTEISIRCDYADTQAGGPPQA